MQARYIHVIEATGPLRLHAIAGQSRPYATSAIGLALMSTWERRRVTGMIRRLNSEETDAALHVSVKDLLSCLARVEREGHAESIGGVTPVGGAVAMVLPHGKDEQVLAVGISGFVASVSAHARDWVKFMRERIDHHFSDY